MKSTRATSCDDIETSQSQGLRILWTTKSFAHTILGDDSKTQPPDVVFTLHISSGSHGYICFVCWYVHVHFAST